MKNKLIVISFVFILLLAVFTFNNNVYASDSFNINNVPSVKKYLGENDKYFILVDKDLNLGEKNYWLYIQHANSEDGHQNPLHIYKDGDKYFLKIYGYQVVDRYKYIPNRDSDWVWNDKRDKYIETFWDVSSHADDINDYNFIVYASEDITDLNGNVVFQKPPVGKLAITLEGAQETMREIIQILPLILVVMVSFLGLRKALSWLLTILRHS